MRHTIPGAFARYNAVSDKTVLAPCALEEIGIEGWHIENCSR